MLNADFYNLTQSMGGALFRGLLQLRNASEEQPDPPPPLLQVQAGRAESPGWFLVQALEFDPEPLTVANLRVRDIYASERIVAALLEVMAAEQWLTREGESYRLSENGRSLSQTRLDKRNRWLAQVETKTDLERLEILLRRVLDACLQAETPPGTWCLRYSRRRAPADDAAVPIKLLQYSGDLNAFRDDAHMAAWQPYDIAGYAWEAFSFVATEQAQTAVALYQQLSYRGYSAADYGQALVGLTQRGWLTSGDGATFRLTEQGQDVHSDVERDTNQYFYAPWKTALHDAEIEELHALLEQLQAEMSNDA